MYFSQELLNQKIQQLIRMQNDPGYKPRRSALKIKAKEEKDRCRAEKKAALQRQRAEVQATKEAAKKAKNVMLARKLKRLEESQGIKPQVDYAVGTNVNSRAKRLPNRELNLDDLIPVQIDRKTVVFVKPGVDIAAIRAKYKPAPVKLDEEKPVVQKKAQKEQIDNDEVRKMVAMNIPVKQIAKMLEIRPSSVKNVIKYLGI